MHRNDLPNDPLNRPRRARLPLLFWTDRVANVPGLLSSMVVAGPGTSLKDEHNDSEIHRDLQLAMGRPVRIFNDLELHPENRLVSPYP